MRTKMISGTALLFCLCTAVLVQAKDFWLKKDYQDWSEEECRKLLQDSPWSKSYVLGNVAIEALGGVTIGEGGGGGAGQSGNPAPGVAAGMRQIVYHVQFRSALPIRKAIIRLTQIQMKYAALSPEQKGSFDEQAEQYLDMPFADRVAVRVAFGSNVPIYERELFRYWETMTLEQVRNNTYLIGTGNLRMQQTEFQLAEPGKQEFYLMFPREHDGKPLVGRRDKRLSLLFEHPSIGELGARRIFVEFPVKKLVIDGRVVY